MGRFTFRLPDIGEGIAEVEIVAWHVKIGDRVEEDGRLVDLMTGKATVEMESPVAGMVLELAGGVGEFVAIGAPLAVIATEGEDRVEDTRQAALSREPEMRPASEPAQPDLSRAPPPDVPQPGPQFRPGQAQAVVQASAKNLGSPAVRARARQLGIDLATIRSAAGGPIRHADLDAWLLARTTLRGRTPPPEPAELQDTGQRIKLVGLRRRIAATMSASKRNIPHFSYVEECDVTALEDLRAELNDIRGDRPHLTMLPLLIVAICRVLPDFPVINARFDDEAGVVTQYRPVHLGLAVQTAAGLMVPVIRDAQDRTLWQLAAEIARLAEAVRSGKLKADELSGSTLTITSLGVLGGIATTPIINRPEVAIIMPNRIVERPMFMPDGSGGERVEKRKLMNISLSCDHRVIDGWDAANFVRAFKKLLEAPIMLLAH